MDNRDKFFLLALVGMSIGFILIAIDCYRSGYKKGKRDGWHLGRSASRKEFWHE